MMAEIENIKENRRLIEEAEARLKLEAEEEANAVQIHANTKIRIAKMRKQKEIQVKHACILIAIKFRVSFYGINLIY